MSMVNLKPPYPDNAQPKQKNFFKVIFPPELGYEMWYVKEASLPSIDMGAIKIPFWSMDYHITGRVTVGTMELTLYDFVGPSTSQAVMEWQRLHTEQGTGRTGYAAGYKKNIIVQSCDPTGVPVSKWIFGGCIITKLNFGNHSYGDAEVLEIKVSLQPDWAEQEY